MAGDARKRWQNLKKANPDFESTLKLKGDFGPMLDKAEDLYAIYKKTFETAKPVYKDVAVKYNNVIDFCKKLEDMGAKVLAKDKNPDKVAYIKKVLSPALKTITKEHKVAETMDLQTSEVMARKARLLAKSPEIHAKEFRDNLDLVSTAAGGGKAKVMLDKYVADLEVAANSFEKEAAKLTKVVATAKTMQAALKPVILRYDDVIQDSNGDWHDWKFIVGEVGMLFVEMLGKD